jgi:hypothetical protein
VSSKVNARITHAHATYAFARIDESEGCDIQKPVFVSGRELGQAGISPVVGQRLRMALRPSQRFPASGKLEGFAIEAVR